MILEVVHTVTQVTFQLIYPIY